MNKIAVLTAESAFQASPEKDDRGVTLGIINPRVADSSELGVEAPIPENVKALGGDRSFNFNGGLQ